MKGRQLLSVKLAMTIVIMVSAVTTIALTLLLLLEQHPKTAQAFPCIGDSGNEFCTGYHDGAIQAHRDFKSGNDMDVDQHPCTASKDYCNGYDRGYSDEEDFLG